MRKPTTLGQLLDRALKVWDARRKELAALYPAKGAVN